MKPTPFDYSIHSIQKPLIVHSPMQGKKRAAADLFSLSNFDPYFRFTNHIRFSAVNSRSRNTINFNVTPSRLRRSYIFCKIQQPTKWFLRPRSINTCQQRQWIIPHGLRGSSFADKSILRTPCYTP